MIHSPADSSLKHAIETQDSCMFRVRLNPSKNWDIGRV